MDPRSNPTYFEHDVYKDYFLGQVQEPFPSGSAQTPPAVLQLAFVLSVSTIPCSLVNIDVPMNDDGIDAVDLVFIGAKLQWPGGTDGVIWQRYRGKGTGTENILYIPSRA